MKYQKQIGILCKHKREEKGITQREISEQYGIKIGSLSAFENGRANAVQNLFTYMNLCNSAEERSILLEQCLKYFTNDLEGK